MFRRFAVASAAAVTAAATLAVSDPLRLARTDPLYGSVEEEKKFDRLSRWQETWKTTKTPRFHEDTVNVHLHKYFNDLMQRGPSCTDDSAAALSVLVPLCGKTKDLHFILEEGHKVVGVEAIQDPIDQLAEEEDFLWAKPRTYRNFTIYNKIPKSFMPSDLSIWKGDFFSFGNDYPQYVREIEKKMLPKDVKHFEVGYDRAALVAIQPVLRQKYADIMSSLCDRILLITLEYNQKEREGPPFSVSLDDVKKLYGDKYNVRLLSRDSLLGEEGKFKNFGTTYLYENVILLSEKSLPDKIIPSDMPEVR